MISLQDKAATPNIPTEVKFCMQISEPDNPKISIHVAHLITLLVNSCYVEINASKYREPPKSKKAKIR